MDVTCSNDNSQMDLVYQCQVQGLPTLHFRCLSCGGRADIQIQNGQARQVRVDPAMERPNGIRYGSGEQIQIPVAYSLGHAPPGWARAQAAPTQLPAPAYQLAPNMPRQLPPAHPMHPQQVRRRVLGLQQGR